MMKEYKHLTEKEEKKLKILNKLKKFTKKSFKNAALVLGIMALLTVGFVAFYKVLDGESSAQTDVACESATVTGEKDGSGEDKELNALSEKELERESEKEGTINTEEVTPEVIETSAITGDLEDWNRQCSREMIVVNRNNSLPKGYKPKVKICRGKEVADIACGDLENMINDAKKDGIKLWISSGYRSIELQTKLFNRQVEREKSKAVISQEEAEKRAATVVARPGTSEHNTGLAVDFNGVEDDFYKTEEYKWLMNNAHKYGFIERYQKKWKNVTGVIYEPWHFRYVGKDNAKKIKDSGLCLEKYVKNLG